MRCGVFVLGKRKPRVFELLKALSDHIRARIFPLLIIGLHSITPEPESFGFGVLLKVYFWGAVLLAKLFPLAKALLPGRVYFSWGNGGGLWFLFVVVLVLFLWIFV